MFKIKWKLYYIMVRMFHHQPEGRNYNSTLTGFLKGGKAIKRITFMKVRLLTFLLTIVYVI